MPFIRAEAARQERANALAGRPGRE